jgi:hypothetical protein
MLRDLWQGTLRAHRWPLDRELKWHGIRTGEVPDALADASYATLAAAPFTAYVSVLAWTLAPEAFPPDEHTYFRSPEDAYATALMFLAEQPQYLLQEEDDRLRRLFGDLTADGTPYTKHDRIVEGLFLGPSHFSIGLQCADLVVAPTAAGERGVGQGSGYFKKLLPRFARHPATSDHVGVGLKRCPEKEPRERERHRLF